MREISLLLWREWDKSRARMRLTDWCIRSVRMLAHIRVAKHRYWWARSRCWAMIAPRNRTECRVQLRMTPTWHKVRCSFAFGGRSISASAIRQSVPLSSTKQTEPIAFQSVLPKSHSFLHLTFAAEKIECSFLSHFFFAVFWFRQKSGIKNKTILNKTDSTREADSNKREHTRTPTHAHWFPLRHSHSVRPPSD